MVWWLSYSIGKFRPLIYFRITVIHLFCCHSSFFHCNDEIKELPFDFTFVKFETFPGCIFWPLNSLRSFLSAYVRNLMCSFLLFHAPPFTLSHVNAYAPLRHRLLRSTCMPNDGWSKIALRPSSTPRYKLFFVQEMWLLGWRDDILFHSVLNCNRVDLLALTDCSPSHTEVLVRPCALSP